MIRKQLLDRLLPLLAVLLAGAMPGAAKVFETDSIWYETLPGDPAGVAVTRAAEGNPYKGNMNIPATVVNEGVTYTVKEVSSFSITGDIRTLTLPSTITKIRSHGISGCFFLTSLILPDNIESLDTFAVNTCVNLTNLVLPSGLKRICTRALDNVGISALTIPEKVEIIEPQPFSGCDELATITVAPANTHFMVSSGYLLTKDGKTLVMGLPGDTRTALNIPATVSEISPYAFYSQDNLTSIIIPDHVSTIGKNAFASCRYAQTVQTGKGVTHIAPFAFAWLSRCNRMTIGENTQSIGANAFESCGSIASDLSKLILPSKLRKIGPDAFTSSRFNELEIPAGMEIIDSMAFAGMAYLTRTTIPSSVREIRFLAFRVCQELANVTLPEQLTYIGEGAFTGCRAFTEVKIPASVTFIGKRSFASCVNLKSITVESGNTRYLTDGGILFTKDMKTLKQYPVGLQDTAYTVPNSVQQIEGGAFAGSLFLRTVRLHDNITTLGIGVFQDCPVLQNVNLPVGLTTLPDGTFLNCSSLRTITLPPNITSIGFQAFQQCTQLRSIKIPRKVTMIHNMAFYCMPTCSLTDIYVDRTTPPEFDIDGQAYLNPFSPKSYNSATLHVPVGSVDAYSSSPVWTKFRKIEEDATLSVRTSTLESDIRIESMDGRIAVTSANPVNVDVYTASGIHVFSGRTPAEVTLQGTGIYIVRAGEKAVKVKI